MMAHEYLVKWQTPGSYAGFSPTEDYLLLSINRDSDTVDESNWQVALNTLREVVDQLPEVDLPEERDQYGRISPRSRGWFYTWSSSHWAVGWVDYLMIRGDAPDEILTAAGEMLCSLEDYPILDDDHHSELEFNQIYDWWSELSLRGRIYELKRARDSIFAARRGDSIPERTFDYIRDNWR